jgi:hypothetical protein
MPFGTVFSDEYATAAIQPSTGVIRYARTATPYPTIEHMRLHYAAIGRAVEGVETGKHALLFDLRAAPPRNDPVFETEAARIVGALVGSFRAHAFLVRTAVGNLQVRRLSGNNGTPANQVFTDEAAALAFLTGQVRDTAQR